MSSIEILKTQLTKRVSDMGFDSWVCEDLKRVLENRLMTNMLETSYNETTGAHYLNIHGAMHTLNVCNRVLDLFCPLLHDVVESDYVKDFGLQKEHVVFALLISAYIHDVGLYYDPAKRSIQRDVQQLMDALQILDRLRGEGYILGRLLPTASNEVLSRVRQLCRAHDEIDQISWKVEIALFKLANLLSDDKTRVYTKADKAELNRADPENLKLILQNDDHPERYFLCSAIDEVKINWVEDENVLKIVVSITDYSAFTKIKEILNFLLLCEKSVESVRLFSQRIRLWIEKMEEKEEQTQSKEPFVVYPIGYDVTRMLGAKFLKHLYEVDILNTNGDAEIKSEFEILNVSNKAGILSHTFMMWGLKESEWEKDVKIEMSDSEGNILETEHKGEKKSLNHAWTVKFGKKLEQNEKMLLFGKYDWKRFLNVTQDELVHTIITPAENMRTKILFPSGVQKDKIESVFEVKDKGDVLYRESTNENVFTDPSTNRSYILREATKTRPGCQYRIAWQLKP